MIRNVLVLCIGNICRSPIAEGLLKHHLRNLPAHHGTKVHSAGLQALVSHPADPISIALMAARGIDISGHRARQVTEDMAYSADLILTMSSAQNEQIQLQFPSVRGRVHRIGKWEGVDIPDPYQRPKVVFEQAFALIEDGISTWYRTLWETVCTEQLA